MTVLSILRTCCLPILSRNSLNESLVNFEVHCFLASFLIDWSNSNKISYFKKKGYLGNRPLKRTRIYQCFNIDVIDSFFLIRSRIMKTRAEISFLIKVLNSDAQHQNGSLSEASEKNICSQKKCKYKQQHWLCFLSRVRWNSPCKWLQLVCFAHSITITCSQRVQYKIAARNRQPEEHCIAQKKEI